MDCIASAFGVPFMFLTYQLLTVGYLPTVAMTGDGELGFDSGEGARETATTYKEGGTHASYLILTQGGGNKVQTVVGQVSSTNSRPRPFCV